jgi:hypothetical protein
MKALQPNPEPFMTSTIQNTLAAAALAASALASPQAQALAFQMQTSGT